MTAIEFNNISKLYRLGMVSSGTLRHDLKRWWTMNIRGQEDPFLKVGESNDRSTHGNSDYVWALKDIDFKVEQGDVVGIIGKNGAGKSTLLKILSRVTAPTTGTIRARGRIGSLLEVGTGFHPEMTGRENIYLNGAILGMTKAEINKKLDEIVDFSGCERYIDTPVKRYSSGMMVRLGFAVAAHLDPEILVVDEVLAVGDAEFQKKAIGKMQDVSRGEGRTVLFVSHNMASIKALCHTGILLNNGHIQTTGPINEVVETYIGNRKDSNNSIYEDMALAPGNDKIRIREFSINPIHGNIIDVESGIHVNLVFYNASANIIIDTTFELRTADDVIVFHTGKVLSPDGNSQKGFYQVSFDIPAHTLNMGNYTLRLWFGQNQKYLLWGFYEHHFHIENTYTNQGHNLNNLPGIMKPNFDISTYFLERPWTHVS
jgi:lipopolysaccharide transport system ATP-binding protein